ncbi:MAG: hypothetical protein CVU71_16180 [Deltaproteobacteria bacterium HGW-Deltaproteobacteria-6]|nr:MAG: hypothetical protein CVU71_16180 [Deltaproteobacteria bacterium HGW-Deltaproteobacteria-6]
MSEKTKQMRDCSCDYEPDHDGIDFYHCGQVIWKRRKMIGSMMVAAVVTMIILSFLMTDIYQAKAVISPVTGRDSGTNTAGLSALAQQLGGFPGVPSSSQANASEIVSLLNSNILRRKIIEQYNLMPLLFYGQWDQERRIWKQEYSVLGMKPFKFIKIPDIWDALRLLEENVKINRNIKDNTITVTVDFHDPKLAALIADYYLVTLTNYMSSEVKRVAATNRQYLEEQLGSTTDPFIKQKTYNLIAQQIENGMMAEVKENFAFKIIDPPMMPDKKIKPRRSVIALLSLVISLLSGIGIALFLEYYEKLKKNNGEVVK